MGKHNKKKTKIGRNDECPCGSGLKFKKCCIKKYRDERLEKIIHEPVKPFANGQLRPPIPVDFRILENVGNAIRQQRKG